MRTIYNYMHGLMHIMSNATSMFPWRCCLWSSLKFEKEVMNDAWLILKVMYTSK